MEKVGFKTFHKWTKKEYEKYVVNNGFLIKKSQLEKGKPLLECVLIATKMVDDAEEFEVGSE